MELLGKNIIFILSGCFILCFAETGFSQTGRSRLKQTKSQRTAPPPPPVGRPSGRAVPARPPIQNKRLRIAPAPAPAIRPHHIGPQKTIFGRRDPNYVPRRNIQFENNCSHSVILLIQYKNLQGSDVIKGPWTITGNQKINLTSNGDNLQTDHEVFYYYVNYVQDEDVHHIKGKDSNTLTVVSKTCLAMEKPVAGQDDSRSKHHDVTVEGTDYPMRKKNFKTDKGNYIFSPQCTQFCSERMEVRPLASVRNIQFENKCPFPVNLVIQYTNLQGNKVPGGPWKISGKQKINLTSNGEDLQTDHKIFYYYASIPDENYSWSGAYDIPVGNQDYPMKKDTLSNGEERYFFSVECDNLLREREENRYDAGSRNDSHDRYGTVTSEPQGTEGRSIVPPAPVIGDSGRLLHVLVHNPVSITVTAGTASHGDYGDLVRISCTAPDSDRTLENPYISPELQPGAASNATFVFHSGGIKDIYCTAYDRQ
ncbi:MAG: hypothetical protein D3923_11345, partial [Candidatus Electrothrix sp. AR3]|nr:hypothetical protein [Candidatus Electrothrix sp. AR3]